MTYNEIKQEEAWRRYGQSYSDCLEWVSKDEMAQMNAEISRLYDLEVCNAFKNLISVEEIVNTRSISSTEKYHDAQLLDHFAGLAMQAEIIRCSSGYDTKQVSELAYCMANEMLKARKESTNGQ